MFRTSEDETLQDWRVQFDAIFNFLPVGIAYLTPDMRYVRVNPYLEKRIGRTSNEIRGLHCYDVVGMYRDDPARHGDERICEGCGIKEAIATGKPVKRTRRVRPDFVAENLGVPVLGPDGRVLGAAEIILDVTERAEMDERLRDYTSRLEAEVEEKAHEKEEFIAMITHDLKAPLTSIIGYSSMLLEDSGCCHDSETKASLEGIQVNAHRMLGLVRDFLSAGNIEKMRAIEPGPVQMESIVFECLKNMTPQVRDKGLTVKTDFENDVPLVMVDKERMERAVTNLITNAIRFTPNGGAITLSVRHSDGHVNLEVADTGVGIPVDELPMLFDKYYQGKSSNRCKGTGLGLYIARNIVEAHKGSINVQSLEGRGTTFTVSLPHIP